MDEMRTRPTSQEHDVLSDAELARVEDILSEAEHTNVLTQFEEEFCDSLRERHAAYGAKTRISDRMWEIIGRIEEKL
jgi:hypothetical protein